MMLSVVIPLRMASGVISVFLPCGLKSLSTIVTPTGRITRGVVEVGRGSWKCSSSIRPELMRRPLIEFTVSVRSVRLRKHTVRSDRELSTFDGATSAILATREIKKETICCMACCAVPLHCARGSMYLLRETRAGRGGSVADKSNGVVCACVW
ncbi:hypothetical protein TRVL_01120 [Trypanosoma vivax]|nr:hypothetical protein TRVL_01120 [Trypanosoma vivax]